MNNMKNDVSILQWGIGECMENLAGSKFHQDGMNSGASYPKIESSMENLMIDDHFDSKFKVE